MDSIRAFFSKIRALFFDFQKKAGEASPPPPWLRACTVLYQHQNFAANFHKSKIGFYNCLCAQFCQMNNCAFIEIRNYDRNVNLC